MQAAQAYRKVAIETSDPREIVVMLYDGFLRFVNRADRCMLKADSLNATRNIGRALDIVYELAESLDHNPLPEMSRQLEALYVYIGDRLLIASSRQDREALREVKDLMSEMREAWHGALASLRREAGA